MPIPARTNETSASQPARGGLWRSLPSPARRVRWHYQNAVRRLVELEDELVAQPARRVALEVVEAVALVHLGILGQELVHLLVLGDLLVALGVAILRIRVVVSHRAMQIAIELCKYLGKLTLSYIYQTSSLDDVWKSWRLTVSLKYSPSLCACAFRVWIQGSAQALALAASDGISSGP